MKRFLVWVMAFSICLLSGCNSTDKQIKNTVEDFVLCVEEDRFDDAAELIHSECAITADEVASYFALLEKEKNLDFTKGFQLIEYEYEDFEDDSAEIKGSYVKATGTVEAKDVVYTFELKIVDNEEDFGIYKIKFREKE